MPDKFLDELNDLDLSGEDDLEDIGSEEEREEATEEANLPSMIPPDISGVIPPGVAPETIAPTEIPTGIIQKPPTQKPALQQIGAETEIAPSTGGVISERESVQQYTPVLFRSKKTDDQPDDFLDFLNSPMSERMTLGELSGQMPGLKIASYEEDKPIPTTSEPKKPGLVKEIVKSPVYGIMQVGQMGVGLAAVAADALGNETLKKHTKEIYQESQETMEPWKPSVSELKQIKGIPDFVRFATTQVVSQLPFMVTTMGVGAITKAIIGKTIGSAIARRVTQSAVADGLAKKMIEDAARAGMAMVPGEAKAIAGKAVTEAIAGYGGAAAASTALETGIIAGDRLINDQKVLSSKLLWAIPAGLLDAFPAWRLATKLKLFGSRVSNILSTEGMRVAKNVWYKEFAKQGLFEGITEFWQEILEEMGAGRKPFTKEAINQALNAFVAGGLIGSVLGVGTNTFAEPVPIGEERQPAQIIPAATPPITAETVEAGRRYAADLLHPKGVPVPLMEGPGFTMREPEQQAPRFIRKPFPHGKLKLAGLYTGAAEGERIARQYRPPEIIPVAMKIDLMHPTRPGVEPLALPPGVGFEMVPPAPKAILREAPPYTEGTLKLGYTTAPGEELGGWRKFQDDITFAWERVIGRRGLVPYISGMGMEEIPSFWVDQQPQGNNVVLTDKAGGIWEVGYNSDAEPGKEFSLEKYTDAQGKSSSADILPQSAVDAIKDHNENYNKVVADLTASVEPPPGQTPGLAATHKPTPETLGLVYLKDQQRYFRSVEDITKGVHKGKVLITLTNGTTARVNKDDIVRMPSEPVSADTNIWQGPAYRSPTGYRHDVGATVADVIRYEEEELGNDLGIQREDIARYGKLPASRIQWVTRTREEAERYGEPEGVEFPPGSKIIGTDGEGGYLVVVPSAEKKISARMPTQRQSYDQWSKVPELVSDSQTVINKYSVSAKDLEYAGLQSFQPLSNEGMHLWTILDSKHEKYKSTVAGNKFSLSDSATFATEPRGSKISRAFDSYRYAEFRPGNPWVRKSSDIENTDRVLLVQLSTNLINPTQNIPGLDVQYYNKLYGGQRSGYVRPTDFWEIPQWIGVASNSLNNADVYVVRNVNDSIRFLNEAKYGTVAFSVLDANKKFVKQILLGYKGKVAIGGYVNLAQEFGGFRNVKTYDNISDFVKDSGQKFVPGTNYQHFLGSEVVPRLVLSEGCLFKCSFCDVKPHGRVNKVSPENIAKQVESIKSLKPKLVYLNDKTFGQASNYDQLADIYVELKQNDPGFDGFIIQTTATQFNKLTNEFIKNSGIKYVEIGVETFNDDILSIYHKPHKTKDIDDSFNKIRVNGLLAIPNIIVGMKEETRESYNNTLDFIKRNQDIVSHVNVYNLAVYAGTDLAETIGQVSDTDINENELRKSWMKDPSLHQWFSDSLLKVGIQQLDKTEKELRGQASLTLDAGGYIPGLVQSTIVVMQDSVVIRHNIAEDAMLEVSPLLQGTIIDNIPGYFDPDKNVWYTAEMARRKVGGEDIAGIPMDELSKAAPDNVKRIINTYHGVNSRAIAPPFYHLSERAIQAKMPNTASASAILGLLKNAGVKTDEMKWTGLDEWLGGKTEKVTKQEVLNYLKQNEVGVEEVMKGTVPPATEPERIALHKRIYLGETLTLQERARYDQLQSEMTTPKFSQWQLPGGENYRELLLTLPRKSKQYQVRQLNDGYFAVFDEEGKQSPIPKPTIDKNLAQSFADSYNEQKVPIMEGYRSSHFDEPNVLAHVRFNDRVDAQGKKVLFIEEVQSDWHQAGREKGYREPGDATLIKRYLEDPNSLTVQEASRAERVMETVNEFGEIEGSGAVPPAPFSKTWHELAMRRMVRWAAENGYDRIAWTTGEQQAARYDLSKQIDSLGFVKHPTTSKDNLVDIWALKDGKRIIEERVQLNDLDKYIGKDLARKIIEDKKDAGGFEGLDLKVGGEGMKGFYDKILPEYMNKFGKKWGAKVGDTEIPTRELAGIAMPEGYGKKLTVHSIDITPEMRDSVLYEGQPMFRMPIERTGPGLSIEEVQRIIKDFDIKVPYGSLHYKIFESFNAIPELERKSLIDAGADPASMAFYDKDTRSVYLFSSLHPNEAEVRRSLFHELLTHHGFERLFGPERMEWVTNRVLTLYGPEEMAHIYSAYGLVPGTSDGDYTASIEKIGEIAQTGENPTLWNRFVTWFRETMEEIFGSFYKMNLTEDDIRVYLWRSRQLIQHEQAPTETSIFNNTMKLMDSGLFDYSLPLGSSRISMRIDTSPSDQSEAHNYAGFLGYLEARRNRDKNFGNDIVKRLGATEATLSIPSWIAAAYPSFKPTFQVEMSRHDYRNKDIITLTTDSKKHEGDNYYLQLKTNRSTSIDKVITWSDQNDMYLEDEQDLVRKFQEINHRVPTKEEIAAYHGWKTGFDNAVDYAMGQLRSIALLTYADTPWYPQLENVIKNGADPSSVDWKTVAFEMDAPVERQISAFQKAVKSVQKKYADISKMETSLREINFYAPHMRGRGEYIVRVYDRDQNGHKVRVWVERFEDATKAEIARVKLQGDYPGLTVEKTYEAGTSEFIFGGLDVPVMEAFLKKAVQRAERFGAISEEAADTLFDAVTKSINEEIAARGFRQHYMHRHRGTVIGGYRTEDLHSVFMDYMAGLAGSMSKLRASYEFHQALQNIDVTKDKGLYEYAARYIRDMLRNPDSLDRKLNALKVVPYAWYLTAKLSLSATQASQNLVTAYPILARLQSEVGVKGNAAARIARAMSDYSLGNLTEEENQMEREAYEEGETSANYIKAIRGNITDGWTKKYFGKVIDIASIPFAGMEKFNRKTSLLAAFRLYREVGMPYDQAFRKAKEFITYSHYAYGLSNYPQALRDGTPFSKVAGMAYVFKSFPHNYVLSMRHFAHDNEGKLALGVMFRSIAMLAILGGLGTIPFLDDLLDEYEQIFKDPVRSKMRKALEGIGGKMLADVGMEGIPALVGVDLSGSLKMQIPIPGIGQFDPNTFTMGVWGGLIDKAKRSISFTLDGQYLRAIEAAAPTGIELPLKAFRLSQKGVRTTSGKPILGPDGKPIFPTPMETGAQALSLRPQRLSVIQKERHIAANIKSAYANERTKIYGRMRTAKTREEFDKLSHDIQIYNMKVQKFQGFIPYINMSTLKAAMKPEKEYMEYERIGE